MTAGSALVEWVSRRIYYGWVIAAVMVVAGAVGMGMGTLNFGLFIIPMANELDVDRATFGWAQSLRQLAAAATGPLFGVLIDRFGARWLIAGGAAVAGALLYAVGHVQTGWHLVALFTLIGLTGFAPPAALTTTVPVLKWFVRRRGRAVAITSLAIPIGAVIFVPATQHWIDTVGWRQTWMLLGILTVVVIAPIAAIFVRRQPEDHGLQVDGGSAAGTPYYLETNWTVREAARTTAFWRLAGTFSLLNMAVGTVGLHRIAEFIDRGMDATWVAAATALDAVFAGIASFVMGMLAHRIASRRLGAAGILLLASSCVLTIYGYQLQTMIAAMIFFGFGIGCLLFLQNIIWAEYFGRAYLGGIRGMVTPITLVMGAIGAPLAGYVKDLTGSYLSIWWISAALLSIGAFVLATTRAPRQASVNGPTA